jgi:hypothetical protein
VLPNAGDLLAREKALVSGIREDCEAQLFVRDLRAKGIRHADLALDVGASHWMSLIEPF